MSSFSLVLPHSVRITVTINTFVRSRSSLENHTRIQTQMGKVYICFQTKKAPKTIPFRAAHTYMAYIGEYPPPPPPSSHRGKILASRQVGCESKAYASFVLYLKVFIIFFMIHALNIFTTVSVQGITRGRAETSFLFILLICTFFSFFFSLINWGFIATFSR